MATRPAQERRRRAVQRDMADNFDFEILQTEERRAFDRLLAQKYSPLNHRMMLLNYDLMVHACSCRQSPNVCPYPKCGMAKDNYGHGDTCELRATGGCRLCHLKEMFLEVHVRECKESNCTISRCRELKEGKAP